MGPTINPTADPSCTAFRVLGVCGGIGSGKSTACKLLVSPMPPTKGVTGHDDEDDDDEEEDQTDDNRRALPCLAHIDADSMAHAAYAPGSQAVHDIVAEFGPGILLEDETSDRDRMEIDRKKLGSIVFADQSAMAKLEGIVWPHVKRLIIERIEDLRQEWETTMMGRTQCAPAPLKQQRRRRPIVVLEAAVLLDAGWDDLLDGVWVVTARKGVALGRLMETRGLSEEDAKKRMDAQESRRGIGNMQEEINNGTVTGVIENNGSLDDLRKSLQDALDNPKFWKR